MKTYGWKNIVYKNIKELPTSAGTYDNKEWIQKQIHRVNNFEKEINIAIERNQSLIKLVSKIKKEKITIVDLGGGFGLSYLPLKAKTKKILDYKIIEGNQVSNSARLFFKDNKDLSFFDDFKSFKEIDIFYIRSTLQYIHDWKKTIEKIINTKPTHVVFSHLAAGDIDENFLTIQIWGDQEIPYWVIKEEEVINFFTQNGYDLTNKSISEDITKNTLWKTFTDLPVKKQIESTISLSFKIRVD